MSGGAAAVSIYAADVYAAQTDTPLLADITQRLLAAWQQTSGTLTLLLAQFVYFLTEGVVCADENKIAGLVSSTDT